MEGAWRLQTRGGEMAAPKTHRISSGKLLLQSGSRLSGNPENGQQQHRVASRLCPLSKVGWYIPCSLYSGDRTQSAVNRHCSGMHLSRVSPLAHIQDPPDGQGRGRPPLQCRSAHWPPAGCIQSSPHLKASVPPAQVTKRRHLNSNIWVSFFASKTRYTKGLTTLSLTG